MVQDPNEHAAVSRSDLARRALGFFPAAVLPPLVGFTLNIVAARVLSLTEVGIFATAMSFVSISSAAGTQWITQSVNRFRPTVRADAALHSAVRHAARLAGFMSAVLVAVSVWAFLKSLGVSRLGVFGIIASAVVTLTVTTNAAQLAWDQSAGFATQYSRRVARFQLSRLVLVSMAGWAGSSAAWALGGAAIAGLFATHDAATSAARSVQSALRQRMKVWLRRMWRYGSPFLAWSGASAALSVGDRPILGYLLGLDVAGRYALQYAIATGMISLISLPVLLTVHPESMRRWSRGEGASARKLVVHGLSVIVLGGSAAMIASYFLGRLITLALFGAEYTVDVRLLPLLALSATLAQVGLFVHKPLEAEGGVWTMVWRMLGALVLSVLAAFTLAPTLGALGVAIGSCLGYSSYIAMVSVEAWLLNRNRSTIIIGALFFIGAVSGTPLILVGHRAAIFAVVGGAVLGCAFLSSVTRRARESL